MCFLNTTIYNLLYIHMYIDIYIRTYVCFADNLCLYGMKYQGHREGDLWGVLETCLILDIPLKSSAILLETPF